MILNWLFDITSNILFLQEPKRTEFMTMVKERERERKRGLDKRCKVYNTGRHKAKQSKMLNEQLQWHKGHFGHNYLTPMDKQA